MPHTMKLRTRTPARNVESLSAQCAGKCLQRAAASRGKWSRRIIIATGLVLMFLLVRATYNYIKPGSSTVSGKNQ